MIITILIDIHNLHFITAEKSFLPSSLLINGKGWKDGWVFSHLQQSLEKLGGGRGRLVFFSYLSANKIFAPSQIFHACPRLQKRKRKLLEIMSGLQVVTWLLVVSFDIKQQFGCSLVLLFRVHSSIWNLAQAKFDLREKEVHY